MKRIINLIILVLVFCNIQSFASSKQPRFGCYGIEKKITIKEYKSEYVGKTVRYLPTKNPSSEDYVDFFNKGGKINTDYIISKISGNDRDIKLTITEKNSKNKIKFNLSNWVTNANYQRSIETIPLFLIDKFNKEKASFIGKVYSHPKAVCYYIVTDISIRNSSEYNEYPEICYTLKNSMTGDTVTKPLWKLENKNFGVDDLFLEDIYGEYKMVLNKVEKPLNEETRYDKTKTIEDCSDSACISKYLYTDKNIEALFFGTSEQFHFSITNVSDKSIKIIWNEASFVGYDGYTSKIMHSGIKYSQKEADQLPTIIIKGAKLLDVAVPIKNIYFNKSWKVKSMYPNEEIKNSERLKLMLPIQIKDVINEYIFEFDVTFKYLHPERVKQ